MSAPPPYAPTATPRPGTIREAARPTAHAPTQRVRGVAARVESVSSSSSATRSGDVGSRSYAAARCSTSRARKTAITPPPATTLSAPRSDPTAPVACASQTNRSVASRASPSGGAPGYLARMSSAQSHAAGPYRATAAPASSSGVAAGSARILSHSAVPSTVDSCAAPAGAAASVVGAGSVVGAAFVVGAGWSLVVGAAFVVGAGWSSVVGAASVVGAGSIAADLLTGAAFLAGVSCAGALFLVAADLEAAFFAGPGF